jgi:hypothetical protein
MFVFRMWQRTSYDWEPEPPLTVHVSAEVSAAPEQLSWAAQDGTECALAFAPDMTTCYGHRRAADAHLAQIRGELDRRETLPSDGAFRGYEFDLLQEVPAGMPLLPPVASVPLVRTDFSDDQAWAATSSEVTAARHLSGGDLFSADVEPVDDADFTGLTATQLCRLVPPGAEWSLLLVADRTTMTSAEHHVLVVDLDEDSLGRTFRATPPAIQEVENNLSLANMDWEDFAYSADDDGVVRPMLA